MFREEIMQLLNNRSKVLNRVIKEIESHDNNVEGHLVIRQGKRKRPLYYHKTEKDIESTKNNKSGKSAKYKEKYIKKSEIQIARKLAQKKHDNLILRSAKIEQKLLNKIEEYYTGNNLEAIFSSLSPAFRELIKPYFITDEEYAENWQNTYYEGKRFDESMQGFLTERGEKVRSKSEKIIADKLYSLGIPYRYEAPVYIKGYGNVYPDFTLLNKRTREVFYLEHFGKMDDAEYVNVNLRKINGYINNGIIPGKKLIMSFETQNQPLNIKNIEAIIKSYCL